MGYSRKCRHFVAYSGIFSGVSLVESLGFNFFVVDEFKNFDSQSFELIKEKKVGKMTFF
jgi:hypothetical protein